MMKRCNRMARIAVATSVALLAGIGGATIASAQDHGASVQGSRGWSMSMRVYNTDTQADGNWTRTNWNSPTGSGGISNNSGYNATVSRDTGSDITAVQACVSRTLLPMVCSSWNNDY